MRPLALGPDKWDGTLNHRRELQTAYNAQHHRCPECRSEEIATTLTGSLLPNSPNVPDRNRAWCICGWKGIVHNLLPKNSVKWSVSK